MLSAFAVTQGYGAPQIGQEQMQQMMQQMQGIQDCMQNVDEAALQAIQQKAEQMQAEVKALCAAGKRDAAQARALAFGREAAASPALQQMQQCGQAMPNLPGAAHPGEEGGKPRHVCDEPQ